MSTQLAPEPEHILETAPSVVQSDDPGFARLAGLTGACLVGVLLLGLLLSRMRPDSFHFNPYIGLTMAVAAVGAMLYHAARDADPMVRRAYGLLGAALVLQAVVVSFWPALLPVYGVAGYLLGLFFLLPLYRHEDDPNWSAAAIGLIVAVGLALAGTGLIGGLARREFLLQPGALLAVLGLAYLWAAVGSLGTASDVGHRLGRLIGLIGALTVLAAVALSVGPTLLYWMKVSVTAPGRYFVPFGLILVGLGGAYWLLSVGLVSDRPVVVVARRELAAYFFSPIAYLVLFGLTAVGYLMYFSFALEILDLSTGPRPQPLDEPIIRYYAFSLLPVMSVIFVVPVITMRLLSEEYRTGTLEVLLTAPVSEGTVVLGKFFAAMLFYLFLWIPWGLFLIGIWAESADGFDYRPLLSFYVALVTSGAAFLGMGLFFSSLTRNQITAAVLTFMGMMMLLAMYLLPVQVRSLEGSAWGTFFKQVSFLDYWQQSLNGKLYVRNLLTQVSLAAFWLYLTTKVLESRKWS